MSAEFIKQIYSTILGRNADSEGEAYWTQQITSGASSGVDLTLGFLKSAEFVNFYEPITKLYYTVFNRIPDAGGLDFWVDAFKGGASLTAIANEFANSAEYIATYGSSQSNDAFLEAAYQNVLGRKPDSEGQTYWLGQLTGGVSKAEVLAGFTMAPEFNLLHGEKVDTILTYAGVLNRTPTQAELDQALLLNDKASLVASLYSATEYSGVAVPGLTTEGPVTPVTPVTPVPDGGGGSETPTFTVTNGGVAITSNAGADQTYKIGDTVAVTVTFNEAATVTGAPTLTLNVGGVNKTATYASGSGTTSLVFNWNVDSGSVDENGISIDANSLALAGGTIKNSGGTNAVLTFSAVADATTHKVDGVAPAAPVITAVADADNASFDQGFTVTTGAAVTVTVGANALNATDLAAKFDKTTANGLDTYTAKAGAFDGTETVKVDASLADTAGNTGNATQVTLKAIDTTAPTISAFSVVDGTHLSVTSDEAGTAGLYTTATTTTLVGSAAALTANTPGSITIAPQGSVTDTVLKVADPAGNVTTHGTHLFLGIDNTSPAGDNISGTGSADFIFGFAGDDTITGGAGADNLTGGDGNDRFVFNAVFGASSDSNFNTGVDTITGLVAGDVIVANLSNVGNFDTSSANYVVTNRWADGNLLVIDATGQGGDGAANLGSIQINIGTYDAAAAASQVEYHITGTSGDDTIVTGGKNDVITGGAGADNLTGGAGADTIALGAADGAVDTVTYTASGETDNRSSGFFTDGGSTSAMDVITQAAIGDKLKVWDGFLADGTTVYTAYLTDATTNKVAIVQGALDANSNFTAGTGGSNDDYIVQWADGTNVHSVVLKDYGTTAPTLTADAAADTLTLAAVPDTTPPQMVSATYDGTSVVLTYSESLTGTAEASDYSVRGRYFYGQVTAATIGTGADANKVFLTLNSAVPAYDSIYMIQYNNQGTSNSIQDTATPANSASYQSLFSTNITRVDTTKPTIVSATYQGTSVLLTYSEALSGAAEAGDYTVTLSDSSTITVTAASINGKQVNLTLATAVDATTKPIQSIAYANQGTEDSIKDSASPANVADAQTLPAANIMHMVTGLNGQTVVGTSAVDQFVFAVGDTGVAITGFVSATDKVNLDALETYGVNGFNIALVRGTTPNAHVLNGCVYLVTGGLAGEADSTSGAATLLNSAANWINDPQFTVDGAIAYFVVVDNNSSAVYKYTEARVANIDAVELSLVGTIDGVTVAGDYLFQ